MGQKSYNELVIQLVNTLGSAATPQSGTTPTPSFRAAREQQQQQQSQQGTPPGGGPAAEAGKPPPQLAAAFDAAAGAGAGAATGAQPAASGEAGPSPRGALPPIQEGAALQPQPINADMLAAALQSSLGAAAAAGAGPGASGEQPAPAASGEAAPATPVSAGAPSLGSLRSQGNSSGLGLTDSMKVMIDGMLAGLVQASRHGWAWALPAALWPNAQCIQAAWGRCSHERRVLERHALCRPMEELEPWPAG